MYTGLYLVSGTELNCGKCFILQLSFMRTEIRDQFDVTVNVRCLGHSDQKKKSMRHIFISCDMLLRHDTGARGGIVG